MHESPDPRHSEAADYFVRRFGVPEDAISTLCFREWREEIWAVSAPPPKGIASRRPPGLRALRRTPTGLKPTSAFLVHLGPRITASRVDVDLRSLESLLLGRRIETDATDGFVALCFRGDVVGCGRARGGILQAVIPTGRRRELLLALADIAETESLNL